MAFNLKNILGSFSTRNEETDKKKAQNYYFRQQLARTSQDVGTWREAVKKAENVYYPTRVDLIGLYQDTILNGHVIACLETRRDLTLLKDYALFNGDQELENMDDIIRSKWFKEILGHALDAKFFGYSLINWGDIVNGSITEVVNVPRENIEPEQRFITSIPYSPSGTKWEESELEDWVVFVTTPSNTGSTKVGLGELYPVAYYEIFLRHLTGFNGDYVELFGQPIRYGKTDKQDEARDEFEAALANMGSSAYVVTDTMGDEINLLAPPGGTGKGFESYDNFEERLHKTISKILLGHADALDSTPGKLGSDGKESPARAAMEAKEEKDNDFIETFVNYQLIPKLRSLGIQIPLNARFKFKNDREVNRAKDQTSKQRTEVSVYVKNLADAGYEMDPADIEEAIGAPVYRKENKEPEI